MSNTGYEKFENNGKKYTRITYEIIVENDEFTRTFTEEEKLWCRPIAETLAMLDGNAFFGMNFSDDKEMWENYLPEAWSVFSANGGQHGWPLETSWMKNILPHETHEVEEAYIQWRTLKALSKK